MKYIFLLIVFSGFALNSFAQKDEKLRFLITDSEETDSAYLNTIFQRIYWAANNGKIKAYYDENLQQLVDNANFKQIGSYCEVESIQKKSCCYAIIDSLVCSDAYPNIFETYSIKYKDYVPFPQSLSVELSKLKIKEIKYPFFWVDFSELPNILTQKQISALLAATKYLPLIEDY